MDSADLVTKEPAGGVPPADMRCPVDDFDYRIRYQRAFEAMLGSWPAVQAHRGRVARAVS